MTESDAVDVIEISLKNHTSDLTTRAMCLIALLKLSSRFPACSQYVCYSLIFSLNVSIYISRGLLYAMNFFKVLDISRMVLVQCI